MSLKLMIKAVQQDLPVTVIHEKWMVENPEPEWSDRALDFAANQLAGVTGSRRRRKVMFRASGASTCARQQVLKYIGHPGIKEQFSSAQVNIFTTGNFFHLKWQMQGLTAGWLAEAEVPVERADLNAGGTADGVLAAGGGWECKSINDRGFARVMNYGPLLEHLDQMDNYMLLGDWERYSIVYENKNDGEWREFVHHRDEKRMKDVVERFEQLNLFVEDKKLPVILPDCKKGEGTKFRQCPFKDTCLKLKGWPV